MAVESSVVPSPAAPKSNGVGADPRNVVGIPVSKLTTRIGVGATIRSAVFRPNPSVDTAIVDATLLLLAFALLANGLNVVTAPVARIEILLNCTQKTLDTAAAKTCVATPGSPAFCAGATP